MGIVHHLLEIIDSIFLPGNLEGTCFSAPCDRKKLIDVFVSWIETSGLVYTISELKVSSRLFSFLSMDGFAEAKLRYDASKID